MKKLKLYGFNNLSKNLSFNLYNIGYTKTVKQKQDYIQHIDELYNAKRLTDILTEVADRIGANILNIAPQDYDPQGASVTMLISEEPIAKASNAPLLEPLAPCVVGHLNKSHITVHTYPESHPENGISTFRADIDVSTCGLISPLNALNYLIQRFNADMITIDYRVRGFTRNTAGHKLTIDHSIQSIQNFLEPNTLAAYDMVDVNVQDHHLFHTKMRLKNFDLNRYLFGISIFELNEEEKKTISALIKQERLEISCFGQEKIELCPAASI